MSKRKQRDPLDPYPFAMVTKEAKAENRILRQKLERLHNKLRGLREVHEAHDPEAPMLDELIRLVES